MFTLQQSDGLLSLKSELFTKSVDTQHAFDIFTRIPWRMAGRDCHSAKFPLGVKHCSLQSGKDKSTGRLEEFHDEHK